jgi:hypothetical protein
MNAGGREPVTPEMAAHNRRVILAVGIAFVVVSVAVFAWGLGVVEQTRARARAADQALRSMGWSILCHAAAHGGAFPTGDAALEGVDPSKGPLPAKGWPASRAEAMDGMEWLPPAQCGAIGVTWPSGGANPGFAAPQLVGKGSPSGFGTIETVNGWLAAYAQSRVAVK